jgi:D-hydroxyproline dehydrogenase subunit alpha
MDALAALATDDTIACRCENVRVGAVRTLLAQSPDISSANVVKLASRTGIGPCQGRFCQQTIGGLTAAARGLTPEQAGSFTARARVKPVPLHAVGSADE